jgi:HK97 family phage major capsid protein
MEGMTMSKKIKQLLKTIKLGTIDRAAQFDAGTIDADARTVELSFSSEEPYERYWGIEILGHEQNEVRLGRLNNAGALLMDHNTRDQIGVIEKAWIDTATRKARALVRFGKSVRATEILQDVIDGIRRNVSVSYDIIKMKLMKTEKVDGAEETIDTYRVTDWEPLEVSLVSVPADATVGVGREKQENLREITIETNEEERKNMEKCMICGADLVAGVCPVCAKAKEVAQREAREAAGRETTRVSEIMAVGKKHGLVEDAVKFITEGKNVAEFKDFVIEKISAPSRDLDDAGHPATSPDAPIYRGSAATMLGQQLMDIRTMTRPDKFRSAEVDASRARLEQTRRRNEARLAEKLGTESRAAASGGFTVGVPSDGGFFLQGETSTELVTNGFNNSEILPRTAARTLNPGTQYVTIYGIDETSRVNGSRGGGIRVYTNKELGELTASKTQFSEIRIEPSKLTGLFYASGEMMRNVTFMGQEIRQLFGEEFAFKCQDLAIRGSGAGEALGILNADALISVAKESGQKAKTINTINLSKMWSRLSGKAPVWFINRDCTPQLDELSITAGTGALEPRFVQYDAQGILRIKGAPVIAIEQCETLGTVGDIILADFSQYITANKGDIMEAMSIHVEFVYDQEAYRFIYYFDGQPRWKSALNPYKGSNSVSPFVALATRS